MTSTPTHTREKARVQLALNVDDVDAAVAFYGRLFGAQPHKRRAGYANFALTEPPLKLVLIENPGHGGTLNHLGVEVPTADEVAAATSRLSADGLETRVEDATTCCYAVQDKVWVTAPGGERWEVYTILDDLPEQDDAQTATCCTDTGNSCCSPDGQCA